MAIKIFKLMTGEEIVAEVTNETADSVSLKNCVALVLQPTRDGKLTFGFVPFASMVDGDVTIAANTSNRCGWCRAGCCCGNCDVLSI